MAYGLVLCLQFDWEERQLVAYMSTIAAGLGKNVRVPVKSQALLCGAPGRLLPTGHSVLTMITDNLTRPVQCKNASRRLQRGIVGSAGSSWLCLPPWVVLQSLARMPVAHGLFSNCRTIVVMVAALP
jgi:hypothetical protein